MEESIFEESVYAPLCGSSKKIDQKLLKIKTIEMPKYFMSKDIRSHRAPSALLICADINSKGEREFEV